MAKYESTPDYLVGQSVSTYESCGLGAVEVAHNLGPIVQNMLVAFDPERPFCGLLYTDCDKVAVSLYKFMHEHSFMLTSLNALEL